MNPDFISAICEEFSEALEDVVDPELLSPQECWDPIIEVLGNDFDDRDLANLDEDGKECLRTELSSWFETDQITAVHVDMAIRNTLARWDS